MTRPRHGSRLIGSPGRRGQSGRPVVAAVRPWRHQVPVLGRDPGPPGWCRRL